MGQLHIWERKPILLAPEGGTGKMTATTQLYSGRITWAHAQVFRLLLRAEQSWPPTRAWRGRGSCSASRRSTLCEPPPHTQSEHRLEKPSLRRPTAAKPELVPRPRVPHAFCSVPQASGAAFNPDAKALLHTVSPGGGGHGRCAFRFPCCVQCACPVPLTVLPTQAVTGDRVQCWLFVPS